MLNINLFQRFIKHQDMKTRDWKAI
jgi:hypothetical protein